MDKTTKILTDEQKLELLTKDFLERDGNTFVKIRRTGRLGWENTLPVEGEYSSFITENKTAEELISNAYILARNMITVMDHDKKVEIRIAESNDSGTDSEIVWVATKVFDNKTLSPGKKTDVFLGLAIHEGCHLLWTNFEDLENVTNKTVGLLENIIEDERIERICGEEKPGLANFLGAAKYYMFDLYLQEIKSSGKMNNLSVFKRLINTILAYIRYPKNLDVNEMKEFADQLLAVRDILTPFPESTKETISAAEKIYDIIKNFEEKSKRSSEKNESSSRSQSDGQEGNPSESQGDGDNACNREKQKNNAEKAMNEISDALNVIAGGPNRQLSEKDQSETLCESDGHVGQVCQGTLERGIMKNTFVERAKENKAIYQDTLAEVRKYIPAVSKALQCESTEYKFSVRGMRNGLLDTNRLAEAYQGVETVYIRQGEVKCNKLSVCILIDESGSMWGDGERSARQAAVLLNEALGTMKNIDLYIYGHTASRKTTSLIVYREGNCGKKYALGSTDSRAGNQDSVAIREAAARIRKRTQDKCLFFMISDGAPNESPEMVREAVQEIEKKGFNLIAISIDPYYDPSIMYKRNVLMTDLQSLALDLGKMVKKTIQDNFKKTVSL